MKKWSMAGGLILSPEKALENYTLLIAGDKISKLSREKQKTQALINIKKGIIIPGLFNSHDHLLGTYYPKVGNGPYLNWLPWDNDLKSSPLYEERQQIENKDLYLLGAYRNLVAGTTSVSDHMPHFVGDPIYPLLPMKAVRRFSLAHSVVSFALNWGDGITAEYKKALKDDIPFVTHIGEGFDDETLKDVSTIDRLGALGDHSVFVHCIAFSQADMKLVKQRGASCVWCGDSNWFMYNETADAKAMLETGINLCIGTDSAMTGGENLLYEMKIDKDIYKSVYGEELPDETLVKMATINAAKAFRFPLLGRIKEGFTADITVVRDQGGDPWHSVVNADLSDIKLVIIDGRPVYGDAEYAGLFDSLEIAYQRVVLGDRARVITGDVIGLMKRIGRAVGFKKEFPFLPVEFSL
jgi:cytosine/adenosine deaminase-related metal-dependent hydrolase